jgi:hypothetical protein
MATRSTNSSEWFGVEKCRAGCHWWTREMKLCCNVPRRQLWSSAHRGRIDVVSTHMTSPAWAEASRLKNHWT